MAIFDQKCSVNFPRGLLVLNGGFVVQSFGQRSMSPNAGISLSELIVLAGLTLDTDVFFALAHYATNHTSEPLYTFCGWNAQS